MITSKGSLVALVGLVFLLVGCNSVEDPQESSAPSDAPASQVAPVPPVFSEVSAEVGIDFVHNTGAFGEKWLPETMGSGCAWVDYDGDGDPDALLLSGADFAGHPTKARKTIALYRNDDGKFLDVTHESGLSDPFYAMGVTYGDYDADGDPDLYITALGPNRLYRNDSGHFTDVAESLDVDDAGFGSSASWIDYDHDGDLDLFTLNYVSWTPETDVFCALDGIHKSYCTPEVYPGAVSRLYRNDGERFVDVTEAAGIHDITGKALGLVCFDYDGDGWDDVFIANDTQPNFLFHNEKDGTFSEQAMMAGVAYDEAGKARGAMGVDFADYDRSGHPSLVVGNFSNEMLALYHNERGSGLFIDSAPTAAVGKPSLLTLAFGTLFFDFDLDGYFDIFVANGHVEDGIQSVQATVSHAQAPHLFRNSGDGTFEDVAPGIEALTVPMVARGAAVADYDGDGDLDLLVTTNGGHARLFRNDSDLAGRSIRIDLVGGAGSNLDGFGSRVEMQSGGGTQVSWVRAANSYCSQSEKTMTMGLGGSTHAEEISVYWPSGKISRLTGVQAGSRVVLREDEATASAE
jgi:hypothetical protein